MHRLLSVLRDMKEQQRMSFVLHHGVFYLNRTAHTVLGNIVKAYNNLLYLFPRHLGKCGIIVYAKHKNSSADDIGKGTNMLGKTFFIVRQATFPI